MAIDENKQKALAAALGQIEKQFGKGSIMRLGEDPPPQRAASVMFLVLVRRRSMGRFF